MDDEKKYTTSLRLYKKRPVHAQAYRYLKNYNTDFFKTKDDFIAEAIIYFSRYLKQQEEEKLMSDMNAFLEKHNKPLMELVKSAVSQVHVQQMPELIRMAVEEALQNNKGNFPVVESPREERVQDECYEKDMQFAQFYDLSED